MINTKFEVQFPGLVKEVWTFLESAPGEFDGHLATFFPSFGFFDRIEVHVVHDQVCLKACDTLNDIEQFAVLRP